jgi:hypothetical protein
VGRNRAAGEEAPRSPGVAGRSRAAVGRNRAAVGRSRAAAGRNRAAAGRNRAAAGRNRAAAGRNRAAAGAARRNQAAVAGAACRNQAEAGSPADSRRCHGVRTGCLDSLAAGPLPSSASWFGYEMRAKLSKPELSKYAAEARGRVLGLGPAQDRRAWEVRPRRHGGWGPRLVPGLRELNHLTSRKLSASIDQDERGHGDRRRRWAPAGWWGRGARCAITRAAVYPPWYA